jgi:cyclophilin family peptidyl-prolyl cis-trans isomerase
MIRRLAPLAVLLVAGCGGSSTATHTSPASPAPAKPAAAATDTAGCTKVAAPTPKGAQHLKAPTLTLSAAKAYTVTLQTNCGPIAIRLDVKRAPKTSASFASLVRRGFYDGLTFHRIVAGFVIQGGDPLGTGSGGPGYQIVEKPPSNLHYVRGVVAMAKTGADPAGASGSQFFIVTGPDAQLPPQYALVGQVSGSMAAVDKIAAEPVDAQSLPQSPVVIDKAILKTT